MIEDAACALGNEHGPTKAGMVGHVGILSFSPHKLVTTGQGGAIVFSRQETFISADQYIGHGLATVGLVEKRGTNLRFNDILASLGLVQLQKLDRIRTQRQWQIQRLQDVGCPITTHDSGPALFNLVLQERGTDAVYRLVNAGIDARRQYKCINRHPYLHSYRDHTKFPMAERFEREAIFLPFGLGMSEEQIVTAGRTYVTIREWMK